MYCRMNEGNTELCPSCQELIDYASLRLSKCKFGEGKTTCEKCKVHCYKPEMCERIRTVMRFAGLRMILYHPIMAVRHIVSNITRR